MACFLTWPYHYLNQYWIIINGFYRIPIWVISREMLMISNLEEGFENYIFKVTAASPRSRRQWVEIGYQTPIVFRNGNQLIMAHAFIMCYLRHHLRLLNMRTNKIWITARQNYWSGAGQQRMDGKIHTHLSLKYSFLRPELTKIPLHLTVIQYTNNIQTVLDICFM